MKYFTINKKELFKDIRDALDATGLWKDTTRDYERSTTIKNAILDAPDIMERVETIGWNGSGSEGFTITLREIFKEEVK